MSTPDGDGSETMKILLSLLSVLIAGVVGLLTSGMVASAYVDWYRVSSFEGGSGYLVMGMALLGGVVSVFVGLAVAVFFALSGRPVFWRSVLFSCGPIIALGGLVAGIFYLLADFPPTIGGEELRLEVEIRLPAEWKTHPSEMAGDPEFVLGSVANHTQRTSEYGELKLDRARLESGRWIVPAAVPLFTSRGKRSIDAKIGGRRIAEFIVPLPAHPGPAYEQWSGWGPQPPEGSPPWPDTMSSYRFRVQRIPPPPPPETEAEYQSRKEAEEQAAFDAIPHDGPIAVWLPYTEAWQNEARREIAIQRVVARAGFAGELGAMMRDGDMRTAEAALRFVANAPTESLTAPVGAAGADIIRRMEKVNVTSVEEDPSYDGAADVMIRFSAWMTAVRALRDKAGGDFIPELRRMLELSRVRTDSMVMQQDVRRVASYHLKTWAGVEPLPGDPPPK